MIENINSNKLLQLSGIGLIPLLTAVVVAYPSPMYLAMVGAAVGAVALLVYPHAYFVAFLVTRASIDYFREAEVAGTLNPATVATMVFLAIGTLKLASRRAILCFRNDGFFRWINLIFLGLLAACLPSIAHSQNILVHFSDFLRLASIIVAFDYAYVFFSGAEGLRQLTTMVVISGLPSLGFGLYQMATGKGNTITVGFNRIFGTFAHPNTFAEYLIILFYVLIFDLQSRHMKTKVRWLFAGLLAVVLFELYHTFTRNAWIALVLSLGAYVLSLRSLSKKVVAATAVGVVIALALPLLAERFADVITRVEGPGQASVNSLEWRLIVWSASLAAITEHWLIGHGLGMFEYTFVYLIHNDYLRLLFEIGVVGLLFYLAFLLCFLWKGFTGAQSATELLHASRFRTVMCLVTAFMIVSMVDNFSRSTVIHMYLFPVLGSLLGRAVERQYRRSASEQLT